MSGLALPMSLIEIVIKNYVAGRIGLLLASLLTVPKPSIFPYTLYVVYMNQQYYITRTVNCNLNS